MRWEKFPSWLKGGIILVLIFVILILVQGIVFGKWTKDFADYSPFSSIELLTEFPGEFLLYFMPGYVGCKYEPDMINYTNVCPNRNLLNLLPYMATLILYFIVGIIIGFIIEKIKSNKKRR